MKPRSITPREQRSLEKLNAVQREVAALHGMKMPDLWKVWDLHFASRPVHPNRKYLTSRLSYRIQELAFGTLPQSTRERLVDYGQNLSKIKTNTPAKAVAMPGATLVREFEGKEFRWRSWPTAATNTTRRSTAAYRRSPKTSPARIGPDPHFLA